MALVTKTYISKSNTIVNDECTNFGLDPIMEINYGDIVSRGILYFDHTKVKNLVEDKTYPDISKLHHVLKLTNTSSLNKTDIYKPCANRNTIREKERASSFDLIFFLINKEWDEGIGYDYEKDLYLGQHSAFSKEASNWFNYRTYFKWDEDGIYSNNTLSKEFDKYTSKEGNLSKIIIGYQHFDYGNEDIELDITETVNKFINEEIPNYGIGVAFAPSFENVKDNITHYVGFYTENTHSFFEPYVETTYDEIIEDDRTNFYLDKDNKLYFYASVGNKYVNLDNLPTCEINGVQYASKQATKGIYYVEVNLSSDVYEPDTMVYDEWSNLSYNGKSLNNCVLSFVTKTPDAYFSFGLPVQKEETEIVPSLYGINSHEEIKRGDIRKVNIECRIQYTSNQLRSVDGIEYRIYAMEGTKQLDIIKWTKVERTYNENYFLVNTNEMVPGRYYIDIKIQRNLELFNHLQVLEFDIVNDVTNHQI
jgi:hypothetical protein